MNFIKKSKKKSQRNFIKQGGGGQRPFISFIKKQEKWSVVPSLSLPRWKLIAMMDKVMMTLIMKITIVLFNI